MHVLGEIHFLRGHKTGQDSGGFEIRVYLWMLKKLYHYTRRLRSCVSVCFILLYDEPLSYLLDQGLKLGGYWWGGSTVVLATAGPLNVISL